MFWTRRNLDGTNRGVQIAGTELSPEDVEWLEREGRVAEASRTSIARAVCERLHLRNAVGKPRLIAARIDLCRLADAGRLELPSPKTSTRPPRRVSEGRCSKSTLPVLRRLMTNSELRSLTVHRVRGTSDRYHEAWKQSLNDHHYLGAKPLCGEQIRYVVLAGPEVIAAASFSSAARHVEARDEFIGWSAAARRFNRQLVITQNRLCMTVEAKNLASRVQSMLLRCVADDWEESYGRKPVLVESFVDTTRFKGTCYRASNWKCVGKTKGRGRQDRKQEARASIKSVWVYVLDRKWRDVLCVEPKPPIRPVHKIDPQADWAETEWGSVDLGDRRLTKRLVRYGKACAEKPTASLPEACGSRAATKAAYRLLNHESASLEKFLSGHCEATLSRGAEYPVVLAIQDTTSLNYSTRESAEGLGPIGSSGATETLGLEVHSLMLSSLDGVSLGLLDINAWARDPKHYGKHAERYRLPTGEKESHKWIRGYQVADDAAQRLKNTQVIVVGDREADMFDLFEAADKGHADLLVRAVYPRRVLTECGEVEGKVWELVKAEESAGEMTIHVPRSGTRPARDARLELRYREVDVSRPLGKRGDPRSVRMWAIAATESKSEARPDKQIQWLLLTTLKIDSLETAFEKITWYSKRWQIEVYHKTLKSGCGIEQRQSMTADTIQAALAIDAVVAWRVMSLTKLAREKPDAPCTDYFDDAEWKGLHCFLNKTKTVPKTPPTMREMTRSLAQLGGFLGRKGDGEPGPKALWEALERLVDIAGMYRLFFSSA